MFFVNTLHEGKLKYIPFLNANWVCTAAWCHVNYKSKILNAFLVMMLHDSSRSPALKFHLICR